VRLRCRIPPIGEACCHAGSSSSPSITISPTAGITSPAGRDAGPFAAGRVLRVEGRARSAAAASAAAGAAQRTKRETWPACTSENTGGYRQPGDRQRQSPGIPVIQSVRIGRIIPDQ